MGGDPDFVDMPMEGLLSKEYAAKRKALIDMNKAMVYDSGTRFLTSRRIRRHFVVIDKWGNMVSTTTTLGGGFGSKEVIEGTGICCRTAPGGWPLIPPAPTS